MQETLCALLIAATALAHQSSSTSDWIGVWQGELDGQPSVTLTLAEDTGMLEGTLVLNIISRDNGQPQIIAREPHVLMRPHVDCVKLSFEVNLNWRFEHADAIQRRADFARKREDPLPQLRGRRASS